MGGESERDDRGPDDRRETGGSDARFAWETPGAFDDDSCDSLGLDALTSSSLSLSVAESASAAGPISMGDPMGLGGMAFCGSSRGLASPRVASEGREVSSKDVGLRALSALRRASKSGASASDVIGAKDSFSAKRQRRGGYPPQKKTTHVMSGRAREVKRCAARLLLFEGETASALRECRHCVGRFARFCRQSGRAGW